MNVKVKNGPPKKVAAGSAANNRAQRVVRQNLDEKAPAPGMNTKAKKRLDGITKTKPSLINCMWRDNTYQLIKNTPLEEFIKATGYKWSCKESNHSYISEIISMNQRDITNPKVVSALGFYFINPFRFPRPKKPMLTPGDPNLASLYQKALSEGPILADYEYIPEKVKHAERSVIPYIFRTSSRFGKYIPTIGTMTCVGIFKQNKNGDSYGIFVTTVHLFSNRRWKRIFGKMNRRNRQFRNKRIKRLMFRANFEIGSRLDRRKNALNDSRSITIKEYLHVADDIILIAIPLKKNGIYEPFLHPLRVSSRMKNKKWLFTVGINGKIGIASDPRYARTLKSGWHGAKRQRRKGDTMLVRAVSMKGDSGGPIVNSNGKLIGIITKGDKHFTVAAYTDMRMLRKKIAVLISRLRIK